MKEFRLDFGGEQRWKRLSKRWEFCIGSCHAATALRGDWQEQMLRCRRELGIRRVRFHGLFDDDMSVVVRPMFSQKPKLCFTNIDKIYDFLLSVGMQPFVELSFMPEALASGKSTVFHYKGNTTPPEDYRKWQWLVEEFLRHVIERYGRDEVRQWYFEVWNEPNLGGPDSPYGFWAADREEYFRLYQKTAESVKRVDPFLRVGGPATSNNAWIPEMIRFCRETRTPLDFISTHQYPTDAVVGYGVEDSANFNNPLDLNDTEKIRTLLSDENARKDFLEEYSVFQQHLWEHVDRGVWTKAAERAVSEAQGLPLFYTEWGSLAGLESDGPFGASFAVKTMLDASELAAGYSFWAFSDIFEESGQEASAFHGGFGLLTQHGIPKAPYRAFELLHSLGDEIWGEVFREETVDGYAVRKRESGAIQLMLVNHHSLLHPIQEQQVRVILQGCKGVSGVQLQRVDDSHANALAAWRQMGAPVSISEGQRHLLLGASELSREEMAYTRKGDMVMLDTELPAMGIALITVFFEENQA